MTIKEKSRGSVFLGAVAGVRIFMHWTFLILVVYVFVSGYLQGHSLNNAFFHLAFVLSVFVCVILHELGHSLVAKKYGCVTRDIILLPIGGMARMNKLPEEPRQELAVAIAGPLVNVVIATLLYFVFFLSSGWPSPDVLKKLEPGSLISYLFYANVMLVVFNLIPAFPMDGGRVLRALLSMRIERLKATVIAARIGQGIALFFILAGFFSNPFLVFIGAFILLGAQAEKEFYESRSLLAGVIAKEVMIPRVESIASDATIQDAADLLLASSSTQFLVMENGVPVGAIDRNGIIKGLRSLSPMSSVRECMNDAFRIVSADTPAMEIYRDMQQGNLGLALVMENEKQVGVIDLANLLEYVLVREAGREGRLAAAMNKTQL